MKLPFVLLAGLAIFALPGAVAAPAAPAPAGAETPAANSADADWARVQESFDPVKANAGAPRPPRDQPLAALQWGLRYVNGILVAAGEFYEKHPDDPRRWKGVMLMADRFQSWTGAEESWSDAERQAANAVIPAAARAQWREKLQALRSAALVAPDVPAQERLFFETSRFFQMRLAAGRALQAKRPVDLPAMKAELDRLVGKYPDNSDVASLANIYLRFKKQVGATPEEMQLELQTLATSSSELVRKFAEEQLRSGDLIRPPVDFTGQSLELAFTAVDGRKVDLKDYRGKVVLVDFWATWCGPCIAEIPNIKKVYAEYRAKGFEIIGIALENARLSPADSAEQTATKHEKAKKVLNDFTAMNDMPWPQYYDGKHWKNDLSARFGIAGIPAMFLLDQNGKVVSTDARGEKLEAEVKRLLKL